MRENDEALEMEQRQSIISFAEDILSDIKSRLGGHCTLVYGSDGIPYEIDFDTVDGFTVTIVGSDTNNGDCFTVMTCIADLAPCIVFSDRRPLSEFKQELTDFWVSLAGGRVMVRETVKKHKCRMLEFYSMRSGKWVKVHSIVKSKGLGAFLFLWKDIETEKICDLSFR